MGNYIIYCLMGNYIIYCLLGKYIIYFFWEITSYIVFWEITSYIVFWEITSYIVFWEIASYIVFWEIASHILSLGNYILYSRVGAIYCRHLQGKQHSCTHSKRTVNCSKPQQVYIKQVWISFFGNSWNIRHSRNNGFWNFTFYVLHVLIRWRLQLT